MASSYNTRSTASATNAPRGGQTQQLQGTGMTATIDDVPQRHFCIALTNNPRMLRKAQQALTSAAAATTTTASTGQGSEQQGQLPPQTRQRTALENRQGSLLPPSPPNEQAQQLQSQPQVRTRQRQSATEQQVVPAFFEPMPEPITSAEHHNYEQNIEDDFKVQIQPILQDYLNKTRRFPPINLFLDMSPMIQY